MNFKDLQYSIGRLTTDVRSQLARNNPLHKQDTKALSMWIFNERNNLASLRTLAYQQSETIKVFQNWTKEELMNDKEENGRDIEDIGDKLVKLLEKQTEIEQQYAARYQQYRHAIKAIRNREDRLSEIREKKRTLASRITNLTKTSPKSPKLRELRKELTSLERDTHDTEMEMGDFKRFALKEAFYLRFNAMNEYAEKTAMIAGFGKYIVDLLDIAPTPATESTRRPYTKGKEAAMIFADAIIAVDNWQPQAGDERPTIATNTSKYQGTADQSSMDESNTSPSDDDTKKPILDDDDDDSDDTTNAGKGKQVMGSTDTAASPFPEQVAPSPKNNHPADTKRAEMEDTPPQLPPRSPLPATTTTMADTPSGYTTSAIASVTSDHSQTPTAPYRQATTEQDLAQMDLYDPPPPSYDETNQQDANATPRNSDEPPLVVADTKQPAMPEVQEPATPLSPPPAPASSHARPITHEDKEQVSDQQQQQQQQQQPTIQYQQSPQPIHPGSSTPQSSYSYHPPHQASTSTLGQDTTAMNWQLPYSGVQPNYHQGQYQQLYDQLTERQQHEPVQRPYSEFQQQYMHRHQDAGGFRIPDPSLTSPPPSHQQTTTDAAAAAASASAGLSADEEKRRLAEKFAMEETQARQASLQTLHQEQLQQRKSLAPGLGSNASTSSKKSVITPEGDDHGYKSSRRR